MPYRFNPIGGNASFSEALPVINGNFAQLDQEAVTKVFKQASGNAIIEGKLPYDGGYGSLYYDQNGVPSIVIGILPDGTTGIAIAKPGQDVLSAFS
jgi:hypothetical protein